MERRMPRNRFFMSVILALILAMAPLRISSDNGVITAHTALAKGGGHGKGGKHGSGAKVKKAKFAKGKGSDKNRSNKRKGGKPIGKDIGSRADTKKAEKQKRPVDFTSRTTEKGKGGKEKSGVAKEKDRDLSHEATELVSTESEHMREDKPKNPRAELGRLNSWNRNYHAYMNSNDPHMAAVREYARNYIEYEGAVDRATAAQEALDALNGDFALTDEPLSDEAKAQLAAANDELSAALEEVARTEALVSDEALSEAILSGANKATGEDYVDDQKLDWAKDLLGVGDSYGKIDQIRDFDNY
jgi:hypothetical protein